MSEEVDIGLHRLQLEEVVLGEGDALLEIRILGYDFTAHFDTLHVNVLDDKLGTRKMACESNACVARRAANLEGKKSQSRAYFGQWYR